MTLLEIIGNSKLSKEIRDRAYQLMIDVENVEKPKIEMRVFRDCRGDELPPITVAQYHQIMDQYQADKKIMAIKLLREFTGVMLKEAKEAVVDNACGYRVIYK